jgi:hypothetical protein
LRLFERLIMNRACVSFVLVGLLATNPVSTSAAGQEQDSRTPKKTKRTFTIGKETTHVTGPRDKDGYIDYAAALNERLRAGVTPANNANVLFWKAFGPHSEVPSELFKWLGIDEPPKKGKTEGKYFVDSFQHVKKHLEIDPQRKAQDLHKELQAARERPWKATDYPVVTGWLAVNEEPLRLVVQGTKRSAYFSPLVAKRTAKGPGGLNDAVRVPPAMKYRELARLLQTRAMLHLGEGRDDDAWQDLLACHRLGRHVARAGSLMHLFVGIAIDTSACEADLVFLDRGKLDGKQIKQCLRDLQALPSLPSLAEPFDLLERFMVLDTVMMMHRYGAEYLETVVHGAPRKHPEAKGLLDNIDWDGILRDVNRCHDRMVAALRAKDRESRQTRLRQFEQELQATNKALEAPDDVVLFLAGAADKSKALADVLVGASLPMYATGIQHDIDRTEQTRRNLPVAFALAAYQRDHGRYPMKLEALAPTYLADVPLDLFSGKALMYRPLEKGCLVYSVGPDGKDEGGCGRDDIPRGDDVRVLMRLPEP